MWKYYVVDGITTSQLISFIISTVDRCYPLPYVPKAIPNNLTAIYGQRIILNCIAGHKFKDIDTNAMTTICGTDGDWDPVPQKGCERKYES